MLEHLRNYVSGKASTLWRYFLQECSPLAFVAGYRVYGGSDPCTGL